MNKELISYLKLFHGAYNSTVILLFIYQGILGLRIQRSGQKSFASIKRHRRIGPFAAILGIAGFIAGMTIAFLDKSRVFFYPFHFMTGLVIISLILTTYIISRKIKGTDPYWRKRHYALGILILFLYMIQAVIGFGILL